jgi:[protein-PII] uridylyltransferase
LGERAEDTFLVTGNILNDSRMVIQLEANLIKALQTSSETDTERLDEPSAERTASKSA